MAEKGNVDTGSQSEETERSEAGEETGSQGRMEPLQIKQEVERPIKDDPKLQQRAETKEHTFKFCFKNKDYVVTCDTSMTVFEALNKNTKFKQINKKNTEKEIIIQRSEAEGLGAAVKTDFPCSLIKANEVIVIRFITQDKGNPTTKQTADISLLPKPKDPVNFYIRTRGITKKIIMKSNAPWKDIHYVCVWASKGQELRTALKNDGRFIDDIFNYDFELIGNDKARHTESTRVNVLNKNKFNLQFGIKKEQQGAERKCVKTESNVAVEDAAGTDFNTDPSQDHINTEQDKTKKRKTRIYNSSLTKSRPIPDSEEILEILRAQHKDLLKTLKKREKCNNSEVQKFIREEYGKSVQSFLEVKRVKQLMKLSESVCQIRVEGSAYGTGFLLANKFILTNGHVVKDFVRLTQPKQWQLFKSVTAAFNYEAMDSEVINVQVKDLADYRYGKDDKGQFLDYALLELSNDLDFPGLLSHHTNAPPPDSGQICIVGHPGEGVKKMDPCFIISKEDGHNRLYHVFKETCLKENWQLRENQIPYDSCFFHGSSGSPVFDEHCNLIGMHSGGFLYKENTVDSVLEYAYSLQPIMENMKMQATENKRSDILEMLKDTENISDV